MKYKYRIITAYGGRFQVQFGDGKDWADLSIPHDSIDLARAEVNLQKSKDAFEPEVVED